MPTATPTATAITAERTPDAPRIYGMLPPVADTWVMTGTVEDALMGFRITDDKGDIACFDGMPGVGKTNTASWVARQSPKDWRYCTLPLNGNRKDLLTEVYRAVFRRETVPSADKMFQALVTRLAQGDIGLIADEAHHLGVRGVQHLRYLWDAVTYRDARFPMLLVGNEVHAALEPAKEVQRRVRRWVHFEPCLNDADAERAAAVMHPRLAACSASMIHKINTRIARMTLDGWHNIAEHIDYLPSTGKGKPQPLSKEDIERLRRLLHGGQGA